MSYHSLPPVYHYHPNVGSYEQDRREVSFNTFTTIEPYYDMSRRSSFQPPMTRYLDEADQILFTATNLEQEATKYHSSFPQQYVSSDGALHSLPMRHSSPMSSGFSSKFSSNVSDCDLAPFTPPEYARYVACSPMEIAEDTACYPFDLENGPSSCEITHNGACVALPEVQAYADTHLEKASYEDDQLAYGYSAQEGYQPMQSECEAIEDIIPGCAVYHGNGSVNSSTPSEMPPTIRRRRAPSNRSLTSPHFPSKITKRPSLGGRSSSTQVRPSSNTQVQDDASKSFPCPFMIYGCKSTFGSKNEWKRHINTQHMRIGYWRCDQCHDRKPNDFNRKDLFIQHVRRMHPVNPGKTPKSPKSKSARGRSQSDADEHMLTNTAARCYRQLRTPPKHSACLFCPASFHGADKWDERLEHIGRHMETTKKEGDAPADPSSWHVDELTEAWLFEQQIIFRQKGRYYLNEAKGTA